MLPCASSRRWPLIQSPKSNASVLGKRFPCLSLVKAGRRGSLWWLLLGWPLLLWWCWPWPGRPGDRHVLVLPLPVSDNCPQQQCDDGHEVKVPLRSQKLVHIKLGEQISKLNEKSIKIIMIIKM